MKLTAVLTAIRGERDIDKERDMDNRRVRVSKMQ